MLDENVKNMIFITKNLYLKKNTDAKRLYFEF